MPTCTPAALADAAKTFQGLSPEQKQSIDTYLLAVIAGGSTDPNTLADAAKCFQCIPPGKMRQVQAYLLCQIASGGGGDCPQDMQVAWTPTNLKLGEELGFITNLDTATSLPGITTLSFSYATVRDAIFIDSAPALTSVAFPLLTACTGNAEFTIRLNPVLTSVTANALTVIEGFGLFIQGNPALTTIQLDALTDVLHGGVNFPGDTSLTTLSLPSFVGSTSSGFDAHGCTSLTTVSLPVFLPDNGIIIDFSNCALNAASVNALLARCVASVSFTTGTVDVSGGTNAAPTGQGIIDKGLLIVRGCTVTTN